MRSRSLSLSLLRAVIFVALLLRPVTLVLTLVVDFLLTLVRLVIMCDLLIIILRKSKINIIEIHTGIPRDPLPGLDLRPCSVQLPTQVVDRLFRNELLESPFVNVRT